MIYQSALRRGFRLALALSAVAGFGLRPSLARAQMAAGLLTSRSELAAAAEQAERESVMGNGATRTRNALLASSIRQRLRDGDFQPGDRVVVTVLSDALRTDTLVVKSGRVLELPGKIELPLSGVLRSELEARASSEILKYIKAQQVTVVPLTRIGVLGEVAHPGYFAMGSDVPLTDAIMAAGGPTAAADLARTVVRRANQELHSADETRKAVASGLTIDQFGLRAGDELIVGKQRDIMSSPLFGVVGALASLTAVFVALKH